VAGYPEKHFEALTGRLIWRPERKVDAGASYIVTRCFLTITDSAGSG